MKFYAINLLPNKTQIAEIHYKNGLAKIENVFEETSLFPLENNDNLLHGIRRIGRQINKNAECYLTLPTNLLTRMDCNATKYLLFDEYNEEQVDIQLKIWIKQLLENTIPVDLKTNYTASPLIVRQDSKVSITAAAIQSIYINVLCKAFDECGLQLVSIETANIALTRYIDDFDKTKCIIELDNVISLTGYDAKLGMFYQPQPNMPIESIINANDGTNLATLISAFDIAAASSYEGNYNPDECDIYISTKNNRFSDKLEKFPELKARLKPMPLSNNDVFIPNSLEFNNTGIIQLTTIFGTALKPKYEEEK
ncbi:MAG: hypothetical protein WC725_04620 [Patescibacteria group bacterium]|jgi:hypothetical protein